MISKQQEEITKLLKEARSGIKHLKNNPTISDKVGQKKLKSLLEVINKIIETDHYKIPFVRNTLQNEFFWFITEVTDFNSRELAMELSALQEKLAN